MHEENPASEELLEGHGEQAESPAEEYVFRGQRVQVSEAPNPAGVLPPLHEHVDAPANENEFCIEHGEHVVDILKKLYEL